MVKSGISNHHAQRIINGNPSSQCPTWRTEFGIAAYSQDSGNWNDPAPLRKVRYEEFPGVVFLLSNNA
jgi:hypothetical protein